MTRLQEKEEVETLNFVFNGNSVCGTDEFTRHFFNVVGILEVEILLKWPKPFFGLGAYQIHHPYEFDVDIQNRTSQEVFQSKAYKS